jgi:hypothetical protein
MFYLCNQYRVVLGKIVLNIIPLACRSWILPLSIPRLKRQGLASELGLLP